MATKKNSPSWGDVKTQLADFDRAGLLGLVQDLYAASMDNKAFLHARLRSAKMCCDRTRPPSTAGCGQM